MSGPLRVSADGGIRYGRKPSRKGKAKAVQRTPREVHAHLAPLILGVRRRQLTEPQWNLLFVLLLLIEKGEDVRGAFYEHDAQQKGAASKKANEEARRRKDIEAAKLAAYLLYGDRKHGGKTCPTLPKVAKAAGMPLFRLKDVITKHELAAYLRRDWSRAGWLQRTAGLMKAPKERK
jgi:hypothetical protein